jgi:hypothetical protein
VALLELGQHGARWGGERRQRGHDDLAPHALALPLDAAEELAEAVIGLLRGRKEVAAASVGV